MKIDTTNLQLQMYVSINYIPVIFFCQNKKPAELVWFDGKQYRLKNKGCINEHYEVENDNRTID